MAFGEGLRASVGHANFQFKTPQYIANSQVRSRSMRYRGSSLWRGRAHSVPLGGGGAKPPPRRARDSVKSVSAAKRTAIAYKLDCFIALSDKEVTGRRPHRSDHLPGAAAAIPTDGGAPDADHCEGSETAPEIDVREWPKTGPAHVQRRRAPPSAAFRRHIAHPCARRQSGGCQGADRSAGWQPRGSPASALLPGSVITLLTR